jgi:Uma2 family endonuclease
MKKIFLLVTIIFLGFQFVQAQKGTKERIKVYSKAIEGNLIGDPAERDVTVYLPPSYQSNPDSRFPVLYMLHGFTDTDAQWFGWEDHWINLQEVIEQSLSEGLSREMIVVMPNGRALPDDGSRYEVVDGELFVTPAPRLPHQAILLELAMRLTPYVRAHGLGMVLTSPADVEYGPKTLVQPDLFVAPLVEGRARSATPSWTGSTTSPASPS